MWGQLELKATADGQAEGHLGQLRSGSLIQNDVLRESYAVLGVGEQVLGRVGREGLGGVGRGERQRGHGDR